MPLGKVVGLGPGHIVSDGDPVGTQPPQQPLPTFGPCLLWSNGRLISAAAERLLLVFNISESVESGRIRVFRVPDVTQLN